MIATAIITAPRPIPTLDESLISYRRAGFYDTVRVYADGPVTTWMQTRELAIIRLNGRTLGNLRNWVAAMSSLLEETTERHVMICEDDITWAANSANVLHYLLDRVRWGTSGVLSLYTPNRMARWIAGSRSPDRGFHHVSIGKKMWGAQCLIFPRAEAHALMDCPYFKGVIDNASIDKNIDLHIAESMQRRGKTILYRIPCLVDHKMGDKNSSLYGDRERPELRTNYFEDPAC